MKPPVTPFPAVLLSLGALAACSSSSAGGGPPSSISEAASKEKLSVVSTAAELVFYPPNTHGINETANPFTTLFVAIFDKSVACGGVAAGTLPASAHSLILQAYANGTSLHAGTFGILDNAKPNDGSGAAFFVASDAACGDISSQDSTATGGSITISSYSASAASGTFDLVFPDGAVKGTFNTAICGTTDATTLGDAGAKGCH